MSTESTTIPPAAQSGVPPTSDHASPSVADHAHGSDHHSHHHEHDPYLEANRTHFDKDAHKYDDRPIAVELARRVGEHVQTKVTFNEDESVLLEYACGTGLVSQALAPYCKTIVGVDISQGMVDWYNTRVANQGIEADEMRAVCRELKGEQAPDELDGLKFDVIICSMAYHHFRSIEETTKVLAFHLKPGGKIIVVDMIYDPKVAAFFAEAHGHGDHHDGHGAAPTGEDSDHHHAHSHHHASHGEATPSSVDTHPTEAITKADDETREAGDQDEEDKEFFTVPPPNVVAHRGGFPREEIERVFSAAGLQELDWSGLGDFKPLRGKGSVKLFCMIGTKQ
ncbi:S-adenosyl-L-methionine-dependent methyltransferase [Clavulina sp. PMI_390]|nr:S-adenosyl-L-methionine-dependent methyltransferase [Clavulina sp. PMI_390]